MYPTQLLVTDRAIKHHATEVTVLLRLAGVPAGQSCAILTICPDELA